MDLSPLLSAIFEDIAQSRESWTQSAHRAVVGSDSDREWLEDPEPFAKLGEALGGEASAELEFVLRYALSGLIHSVLVVLDGGAASAEVGTIDLVDGQGESIGDALHERFGSYLLETDRLL